MGWAETVNSAQPAAGIITAAVGAAGIGLVAKGSQKKKGK